MSDERAAFEVSYRQYLQQSERHRLDAFMANEVMAPAEAAPPPQAPKPEPKPGVLGAGIKAGKEALGSAYTHFTNGLYNAVGGKLDKPSYSTGESAGEVVSGMGEMLLGGLTLTMALPAGVGASVQRAMETYVPGLEKSVAIGEKVAGVIRTTLAAPMLLDPNFRAQFHDSQKMDQVLIALNAPMTYGELMDTIVQFAVPVAAGKMAKRAFKTAAPEPEPLQVKYAADPMPQQKALPPAPYEMGTGAPEPMTAEHLSTRLMLLSEELRAKEGKPTPKAAPAEEPAPTSELTRGRVEVPAPEAPKAAEPAAPKTPEGPLQTAGELAMEHHTRLATALDAAVKRVEAILNTDAEAGKIAPGLLVRMAVGAAIGGTQGDTPEERIAYALAGMGLGAASSGLARKMAAAIREDPKAAPILEPTNPRVPGWSTRPAVQPGENFQPNYARIETTPQTVRVMKNIYRSAAGDIAEQGRGVRTLAMQDTAAMEMLRSGKMTPERIAAFEPGTTLTGEALKAARHIEVRAAEYVSELADRIHKGEPFEPGELRQAIAVSRVISTNVRAVKAETGRALGSLNAMASSRGAESVKITTENIDRLAREWNPSVSEESLAAAVQALPTTEKVGLWTRLYYAVPEAATEAMYGAMLSGKALVKNVLGNAAVMPLAAWDRSLASLKFWDPNRPMLSEGPMAFQAIWEGSVEQMRLLRKLEDEPTRAWLSRVNGDLGAQAESFGGTKMEVQSTGLEAMGSIASDAGLPRLAKAFEWMHTAANLGPDFLRNTDGMSKAVNGRMAIQWEAMRQARNEGVTGEGYWKRVEELTNDYSQLEAEALVRIKQFRDHQTFTQPLEGRVLSALQAGPEDPWLNMAYRLTIAPFVRTPLRLAEFGAEYTPGVNFLAKHFYTDIAAGGPTRAVAQARLLTGGAVIGGFAYLAMQGLITGSPPTDPHQAKALLDAGRPPQSFWDPLVGKYRSYAGMEPLTTLVSTGADLSLLLQHLPEADFTHLFLAATLAEVNNLNAKSYTQAISELTDVIKSGRSDTQYDKSLDYIRRRLSAFLPAGLREAEGFVDPTQRRAMPSGAFDEDHSPSASLRREVYALMDQYRAGIPGLSGAVDEQGRPLLKPVRNMFTGDPNVNDTWPFNPFTAKPDQPTPWAAEIRRLDGAGLAPLPDWIGKRAAADVGMTDQPASPGVRLTPSELDRWEVLMTQVVRDRHGKLTDSLDALVQSNVYSRFDDVTKRLMLQQRYNEFRERAEGTLLKEFPALDASIKRKQGEAQIERMPRAQKPAARQTLDRLIESSGR